MKILISLISYKELTGAELYVYELSKRYKELGHQVLVTAPLTGGEIAEKSKKLGVEVFDFADCPQSWKPDILHVNEYMPTIFALTLFPKAPAIATVHSQFLVEKPFVSNRINKYVCIRPQVRDKVIESTNIEAARTTVIYNGIDFTRFSVKKPTNTKPASHSRHVLFVGTIDPLRKLSILDLIKDAKIHKYKVTIVGKKYDTYLDNPPEHVKVYEPTWDIERYFEGVTETAGILLGRTTIEGWGAGIPGWIYEVDLDGNILSKKLHNPPEDIRKFDVTYVADQLITEYKNAIKGAETNREDGMALAQAQASIIANVLANERNVNYHAGEISKLNELVNFLGSENYNVHIELQKLAVKIDETAETSKVYIEDRLREERDRRLAHRIHNKSIQYLKNTKKGNK